MAGRGGNSKVGRGSRSNNRNSDSDKKPQLPVERKKMKASSRYNRMVHSIRTQNKQDDHDAQVKEMEKELKNLSGDNLKRSSLNERRNSIRSSIGSEDGTGGSRSNNNNNSISIGSSYSGTSEQELMNLRFLQERTLVNNYVKERLRKIQLTKKTSTSSNTNGLLSQSDAAEKRKPKAERKQTFSESSGAEWKVHRGTLGKEWYKLEPFSVAFSSLSPSFREEPIKVVTDNSTNVDTLMMSSVSNAEQETKNSIVQKMYSGNEHPSRYVSCYACTLSMDSTDGELDLLTTSGYCIHSCCRSILFPPAVSHTPTLSQTSETDS